MNDQFIAEILRATGNLRSGDPAAATAIIQAALGAAGLTQAPQPAAPEADAPKADTAPARKPLIRAGDWTDAQVVDAEADTAEAADETRARADMGPVPPDGTRPRRRLSEVVRVLSEARAGLKLDGLGLNGPGFNGLGLEGLKLDGFKLDGLPGLTLPGGRPMGREAPLPDGAEFRDLQFTCAAGARRYRLYVPASVAEGARGLVVMLHGCTQTPEDFAAGTGMNAIAETHRLVVAYPAQTGGDNTMSCWNWFRPTDQGRGGGEPAILAGLAEQLRDEFAVPRDKVFVAGLSAGGAMAAILGETYPDVFAAVGVHSGLAHGSARDVVSALSVMRGQMGPAPEPATRAGTGRAPRMIVFHGASDTTVHPGNADRVVASQGVRVAEMERGDQAPSGDKRGYVRRMARRADGAVGLEFWMVDGAAHAWSGGHSAGSYTDPRGPDASAEMARFFLE